MRQNKAEKDTTYRYRSYFRFLWERIQPYRGRFFLATFFRLSSDIVWLYPSYALARGVTVLSHIDTTTGRALLHIGILWVGALVWRIIGQYFAKYIGFVTAERAGLDANVLASRHLFRLDMYWHERENAGNKLKRIDRGGQAITKTIRLWFLTVIAVLVDFIGVTIILSQTTPGIALSLLVFVIIFLTLSTYFSKSISSAVHKENQNEEHLLGLTFEAVNNIRTVKALGIADTLFSRITQQARNLLTTIQKRIRIFQARSLMLNIWGQLFRFASIVIIAFGVLHGRYEVGFLVLFYSYFSRLWESVGEISDLAPEIVSMKNAVGRLQEILHEPVVIDTKTGKRPFPRSWQMLSLDNLSFSYGGTRVLRNISFTIKRGERIGIVGLSGAGKTTLFKLLLKEREEYKGMILFDGVSLRGIEKHSYLQSVAAVLQDTEVFNLTLEENIRLARRTGTTRELQQATKVSHVSDFVQKLPQGMKTVIGEKGFRLSGGEKQRVGLARAIFKQPQLLLLDEATSHLDIESEKKIQDSLHHVFQSVTAIVIAHRLTTIKEMDRILVIHNGTIEEQGTFDELYARRGRFFTLWEQQKL